MVSLGLEMELGTADKGSLRSSDSVSSSEPGGSASTSIGEASADSLSSSSSLLDTPKQAPPAPPAPALTPPPVPEHLEDAFDKLGVASELLSHWEALEANVFANPTSKKEKSEALNIEGFTPARPAPGEALNIEGFTPPAFEEEKQAARGEEVESKVRGAALWCLQQILVDVGLPTEAWFHAAALLDAYLIQASGSAAAESVKRLPLVVAVIARMMKKESREARSFPYKFHMIPAWVAQHFGALGHHIKVAPQVSDQELNCAEHHVLGTLQWRVNLPTLASWTTAYFKRLDILTENQRSEQIRTAWQRTLLMGQLLIAKQAPTAECSPQCLARGLLVLSMMSAESGVAGGPAGRPLSLEAAAGASASALQDDCRVAVSAIRRAGYNPWSFGATSERPVHHASV